MTLTTAEASDEAVWYFASREGKQEGPVAMSVLVDHARAGELRRDDLVWKTGLANWVAAREVEGLFPPKIPGAAGTGDETQGTPGSVPAAPAEKLLAHIGSPAFYQICGRICGLFAVLIFMFSVLVWYFGYAWFTGAVLFGMLWFLGEGIAAILRSLEEIQRQRSR